MKTRINKLKQIASFQFRANPILLEMRPSVLTGVYKDEFDFLEKIIPLLRSGYRLESP